MSSPIRKECIAKFYFRLFRLLFSIFGLYLALPLIVWDIASRHMFGLVALGLSVLSALLPTAVIFWLVIEDDPDASEVPFRINDDAVIRALKVVGSLLGAAAVLWAVF